MRHRHQRRGDGRGAGVRLPDRDNAIFVDDTTPIAALTQREDLDPAVSEEITRTMAGGRDLTRAAIRSTSSDRADAGFGMQVDPRGGEHGLRRY